jgi:hypothetical protein
MITEDIKGLARAGAVMIRIDQHFKERQLLTKEEYELLWLEVKTGCKE